MATGDEKLQSMIRLTVESAIQDIFKKSEFVEKFAASIVARHLAQDDERSKSLERSYKYSLEESAGEGSIE